MCASSSFDSRWCITTHVGGGTANQTAAIIATIGANGPCQVDDAIAADTATTQGGMAVWAKDELVVDTTLTLWADKLLFDVVAQVLFFE